MSGVVFSMILNGVMIVLLGATILYAIRLSSHLKTFRDSRKDFDRLVRDLGGQIEKADIAIAGLKQAAKDNGRNLQDKIDAAKALSDELQLMVESGDSIASRIEKQAEKRVDIGKPAAAVPRKSAPPKAAESAFSIRDIEFDTPERDGDEDFSAGENMQSRAERDLYDAMRKRGKPGMTS